MTQERIIYESLKGGDVNKILKEMSISVLFCLKSLGRLL